jgi:hypothetical protein
MTVQINHISGNQGHPFCLVIDNRQSIWLTVEEAEQVFHELKTHFG